MKTDASYYQFKSIERYERYVECSVFLQKISRVLIINKVTNENLFSICVTYHFHPSFYITYPWKPVDYCLNSLLFPFFLSFFAWIKLLSSIWICKALNERTRCSRMKQQNFWSEFLLNCNIIWVCFVVSHLFLLN